MYSGIVFAAVLCLLYYYFTRTLNYWRCRKVKGPNPIPLFGNFIDVALRRKAKVTHFHEIYKQYPEEKVVGVYQMTSPTLLIRDLDIVKQVLIKDFDFFSDRGMYYSKDGFGHNLIHCEVDAWKVLRNRFTMLFTTNKFKNILPILVDRGDKFVDFVKNVTSKQPEQDVFKLVFKYSVGISIATTFGWDVDTFNNKASWFNVLDEHFINSHWYEIDLLFPGLLMMFNLSIVTKKTRKICHEILKSCLNQQPVPNDTSALNVKDVVVNLKKNAINNQQTTNETNSGVKVTDDLLASQLWVFHMAGYINNTLTLTYALYHLAHNPDIQNTLSREIDNVMEKCDGKLTYELLKEMNYLKMVFEETLRMHPSSHVITRSPSKNINLEATDLIIEKGISVVIPLYSIQHDEQYFPEPEKFNPERFSPENLRIQHPCSFLSFGAGRRGCMASRYAQLQFGVGLAKLLYHFKIEWSSNTCSSLTFDPYHMLVKPQPGVILKFVPREK